MFDNLHYSLRMRSAFTSCGRVAFARGNTAFARSFNTCLKMSQKASFPVGPSQWRMMAVASPTFTKFNALSVASEIPVDSGYAEQPDCSQAGITLTGPSSSDEVVASDESTDGLTTKPAQQHVALIKSLSDVIVFCTYGCTEMGCCHRWQERI